MSNIEKFVLGLIAGIAIFIGVSFVHISSTIEEAGGMKAVIIEAGKEIKDIGEQIDKGEQ